MDIFFIDEEVDGIRVKGSGNTITDDIKTHLGAFLNMSLRFACLNDKAFFWQTVKLPVLGPLYSSVRLPKFPS